MFVTPTEQITMSHENSASIYADAILNFLLDIEKKYRPEPNMNKIQDDVKPHMRSIVIDWMVEVCYKFRCDPKVIYLAVNYMDRYLSVRKIKRTKLQLVATTAMWIASKYEDELPQSVATFAFMTDGYCSASDIQKFERSLLRCLSHDISVPTPCEFFDHFQETMKVSDQFVNIAKFVMERSLQEAFYLQCLPSEIFASATILTNQVVCKSKDIESLVLSKTRHTLKSLYPCMTIMVECWKKSAMSSLKNVSKKYASSAFLQSSNVLPPTIQKLCSICNREIPERDFPLPHCMTCYITTMIQ